VKNIFKNIGPGALIAAAFIGPGTVTVCVLTGVEFGFTLLWAMVLSIIATIVLQEMAIRLGLVYGKGLAEAVRSEIPSKPIRIIAILLILSAILIGNAAYEAGNISGGMLGLETIFTESTVLIGSLQLNYLSLLIGGIAFTLLFIGNYKVIERSLVVLVILMSISFLVTAIVTNPNWMEVLKGMFTPSIPEEGVLAIIALVGTTVVPYNLFLHASLVKEKWNGKEDLKAAKTDLYLSIILGGLVSIAIIVCAASIKSSEISNAADLAKSIEPLFGSFSKYFLSLGLFAAGISSAITAPLAAAYVARGCFDWESSLKSKKFRAVWMLVLLTGVLFSSVGFKPIEVIQFAQVANGILLPVIAGFLVWVVNKESVLGTYKNSKTQNIIGIIIVLIAVVLGLRSLSKVFLDV